MATRAAIEVQQVMATSGFMGMVSEDETLLAQAAIAIRLMLAGDWGLVDDEDRESNNRSLRDGSRMIGAYMVGGKRVWCIVEAGQPMTDSSPARRSVLTLLLPEEY